MVAEDYHILLVEPMVAPASNGPISDANETDTVRVSADLPPSFTASILRDEGFKVTTTWDCEEALTVLRSTSTIGHTNRVHAVICAIPDVGPADATCPDATCPGATCPGPTGAGVTNAGMTGTSLLVKLRSAERLRHIPIILIVSGDNDDAIAACTEHPSVDFVVRPIRPVLLLARVRTCLERSRMAERERDYLRLVELERRRAEMLLYDVLPAEIAARMKHGEQVIADHHPNVTVLFADLVGFTGYADGRSPAEVVRTLDTLFSRFDELAADFSVEKIKTIGDGYMAAAGLPTARIDHAEAAADLALAMREVVHDTVAEDGTRFSMRLGMASGPVIAGVIGQRRHVYDLWGDTVNLASRMESTAPNDAIQVCAKTARLLAPRFHMSERGLIEIKGKSPHVTSLVGGRRRSRRLVKRATFARTARFEVRRALELAEQAMLEMQLVDAESGLLSPRGFLPMVEAKWQRAAREAGTMLVLVARIEADTVSANDAKLVARLLRGTFRDTDLLVRWDQFTFAMIGMERSPTPPHVLGDRLRERAATFSAPFPPPLRLSVRRLQPVRGEDERRLLQMLNETPAPEHTDTIGER